MNSFLHLFETTLAGVADQAIQNPTGGFLGYLQKNPRVGALYLMLLPVVHGELTKLEGTSSTPPGPVNPTVTKPAGT
jgi:hypothetical protein